MSEVNQVIVIVANPSPADPTDQAGLRLAITSSRATASP